MKNMNKGFHIFVLIILFFTLVFSLAAEDEGTFHGLTGQGEKTSFISIDHDFSDWEKIPPIVIFSSHFTPHHVTREKEGIQEKLPLSDAAYWGFNGTRLNHVKGIINDNILYLSFSTGSPIAQGLIIFMYLYKTRNTEKINTYTIEISLNIETGKGKVFLWESNNENVTEIGNSAIRPWNIECMISLNMLPQLLGSELLSTYSFDLTTCFYEKITGIYEEFYYTTVFFKDIPLRENM
jgi:hypothetical protein